MKSVLLLSLMLILRGEKPAKGQIAGGSNIELFPYFVLVHQGDPRRACGGTIVGKHFVLTSDTCFD